MKKKCYRKKRRKKSSQPTNVLEQMFVISLTFFLVSLISRYSLRITSRTELVLAIEAARVIKTTESFSLRDCSLYDPRSSCIRDTGRQANKKICDNIYE